MSTYEDIFGKRVKFFDSDPTLDSSYEGQVWYNSADGVLKSVVSFDSWVSSTPNTTGRRSYGSSGTQTANLIYAGSEPHPTVGAAATNVTEEYNGTGWASGGNFGASGYGIRGMGTQTAALSGGLFTPGGMNAATYKYDGTSWTSAGSLPAARAVMGTAGTQTAGLAFAGSSGPSFNNTSNTSYEYDGSSWTAGNSLTTARTYLAGIGTQTAAVGCGGYTGNPVNTTRTGATEEYDGTNWTSSGAMNTARTALMASGIQTAGLVFGGHTGSDSSATEKYDGSTWATSPATLGTANKNGGGSPAGTQSSALNTEGGSAPYGATVEEFNTSINTFTAAAWGSGGTMGTSRGFLGSAFPSQTSGLVFGGTPYTGATEQYDGTSWTEKGDLNTARSYLQGFGTATAAVAAGGYGSGNSPKSEVEEWNGTAWSEETNLPGARKSAGACGTLTAGLLFGGASAQPYTTHLVTTTFEYDGTNWTSSGALPVAKGKAGTGGTQTAAFYAGGTNASSPTSTENAEYDGSSWTAGGSLIHTQSLGCLGATGTLTAGLVSHDNTKTENYNGTSFSTAPNYNTGKGVAGGGATQTDAIIAGGSLPPYTNQTEEFTAQTETTAAKTLTTG